MELRDKVGVSVGAAADNIVHRGGIETQDEAIQALVALGYSDADAHATLTGIPKDLPLEESIRQALKK